MIAVGRRIENVAYTEDVLWASHGGSFHQVCIRAGLMDSGIYAGQIASPPRNTSLSNENAYSRTCPTHLQERQLFFL